MADNDGQGSGSFVFGFILGAIGGAVAALFLTPKSGETLRKDVETRFSAATAPVRERTEPLVIQGKERASEFIDKAADRAQEVSGKIAAMDLPFQDDDGPHAEPSPTPPTTTAAADEETKPETQ
jgi:gas vesicle protein